jgi:nitrilase
MTAAVVQAAAPLFDTAAAVERAQQLLREAVTVHGASLVVFPEAFLGGYPKGFDFGVTVGERTPAGREVFRRYHAAAVEIPGPEVAALAAVTRELGCHAVVGAVERRGGTLFCSALFFGPDGYLAVHRKLMPTAAERYLWGQGDGSTLPVVDTGAARICAGICWENRMPLFRAAMYAKGVDIWCAPTVDARDTWQTLVRHIAFEGRCFVLAAAPFMRRDAVPADLRPAGDSGEPLIDGGSVIVSPLGEVLAGPLRGTEGILTATLDLDDRVRGLFDFDPSGHYARPDVFTLHVDTSARAAVTGT